MLADVGQWFIFPPEIAATNLRPDIVLWSGSARLVHLVELTVPWEDSVDEAYKRRKLWYTQIATEAEQCGWRVQVYPVKVYQMDTGHYLCRNKYYGRGLSNEGFQMALYQFMHNGNQLRRDLFQPILGKLRNLVAVLEKQASYRFYSSSLLIIYDGKQPGAEPGHKPAEPPGLDPSLPTQSPAQPPSDPTPLQPDSHTTPGQPAPAPLPAPQHSACPPPKVDVRMIDFAHSTFKGFRDDQTVHDGPDRGYVFGLQSLISILEGIQKENQ
ncbi:UNVERIFIED_CONTAM: hypothetical protein FKN15_064481 [Acipenser sinensis]